MSSSTSSSNGAVKLLRNIFLLLAIVVVINQLILALLPYSWADAAFNDRYLGYLDQRGAYDTLFIGSSMTQRHVDPAVFDEQMAGSAATHAYNLGAGAHFFPMTARTFQVVLADKPPELERVFFELMWTNPRPDEGRWHTARQVFWQNGALTRYLLRSLWRADVALEEKLRYTAVHTGSLLEKNLSLGFGGDVLGYLQNGRGGHDLEQRGFLAIDVEQIVGTVENRRQLRQRRAALLANPGRLAAETEAARSAFTDPSSWNPLNDLQLDLLQQMRAEAQEAGVELIFVLPPRQHVLYRELLPLFYALPPEERIDLADPDRYPQFYTLEESFDFAHMRGAGAELYTRALADAYRELRQ